MRNVKKKQKKKQNNQIRILSEIKYRRPNTMADDGQIPIEDSISKYGEPIKWQFNVDLRVCSGVIQHKSFDN